MRHWKLLLLAATVTACSGSDDTTPGNDDAPPQESDTGVAKDADKSEETAETGDTGTTRTDNDPCGPLLGPQGRLIEEGSNLRAIVSGAKPGDVLRLEAGTYEVNGTITVNSPITIRGATDDAADVTIVQSSGSGNLFDVRASDVTLAHVTLTESDRHAVHLATNGARLSNFRMHDVYVLNAGRYGVFADGSFLEKGEKEPAWPGFDNSEISCSTFELEKAAVNDLDAFCVTGAIDAYGVRGWTVRDNVTRDLYCPGSDQNSPSIRFWRGSRGTVVTRNILINSPVGIVVGQSRDEEGRVYDGLEPNPCPPADGRLQHYRATVTNNIISSDEADDQPVGIRAEASCDATIVHNSIYALAPNAPGPIANIESVFPNSTGVLANNLMSDGIARTNKSAITVDQDTNWENAKPTTWFRLADDDFHTAPASDFAIDQGSKAYLGLVPVDVDDEPRKTTPDIGADEVR